MKKNFVKILLISLLCFCFVSKVNAGNTCDTNIKMIGVKHAGFDTKVAYCDWQHTGGYGDVGSPGTSFSATYAQKDTYVTIPIQSYSSKIGGGSATVKLCNDDPEPRVKVTVSFTCTQTVVKGRCEPKYRCDPKPATKPVVPKPGQPVPMEMSASYELADGCGEGYISVPDGCTQYYVCPEGYSGQSETTDSSAKCTKDTSYVTYMGEGDILDQDTVYKALYKQEGVTSGCRHTGISYQLQCPTFTCGYNTKVISACVENFKVRKNGSNVQTAFCVNPDYKYPDSNSNNYMYNSNFDVQKCSSSHSTVDCGYANILIERAYYNKNHSSNKISENSAYLAIRLWGAHSQSVGYNGVGLANTEGSCSQSEVLLFHPTMISVYKETLNYITNNIFSSVNRYIQDHENSMDNLISGSGSPLGDTFAAVPCQSIGIVCGIDTPQGTAAQKRKVYRDAYALYFNTLIGNSNMLKHLQYIYGNLRDTTPEGATIVEELVREGTEEITYKTVSKVEVSFDEDQTPKIVSRNNIVDCQKLRNDSDYVASMGLTSEDVDAILPYCQVTFTIVDGLGNPITGVDERGRTIVLDHLAMEECNLKTFSCYSKKFEFSICDFYEIERKAPGIIVHYTKTKKSYSVRKYTECGGVGLYQTMFAFYDSSDTNDREETEEGRSTFDIIPSCRIEGKCKDLSVRKTEGKCENSAADKTTYNDTFVSYVKDPPLNCILNSVNGSSEYDYSEIFGVNTDVCRVYCSDSVEYIMADKIRTKSGRIFKFDIEIQATKMRQSNPYFTSVIRERRSCISKIYVGNNKFDDGYDWEKLYGITSSEISTILRKPNIENLNDLLVILSKKSESENNRKENINKLLFDLYNCNLYEKSVINSSVNVSNAKKVKYVIEEIRKMYSVNNNFGLSDCKIFDSNGDYYNDCVTMGGTTYEGGAELATTNAQGNIVLTGQKVGENSGVSMSAYVSKNAASDEENTIRFSLSNVKYCNGNNCVKYDENSSNPDDYNIFNGGRFGTTSRTRTYDGRSIPNNEFAMFEITTTFGFFNNNKYQVYPDNGYVRDITNGGVLSTLMHNDYFTYPSSKNAYNVCSIKNVKDSKGKVDKSFNRCEVTYNIDYIHTYKRNYKSNNFLNAINELNQFTCYIDFEPPQPCSTDDCKGTNGLLDNTLYRNIDTSKMFNNTPEEDSNWATQEGIIATASIEASSDALKQSDDYLEYSITLSPNQIRAIRSDINRNTENGSNAYINEGVYGCTIEDNTYRNCKSYFLDELRKGSAEAGTAYGTIDPNYSNGVSKHSSGN